MQGKNKCKGCGIYIKVYSRYICKARQLFKGYQLWQGIIAFGMGGVEGVGLGSGQQQMSFLPEAHTDFIFSIIGEELGLFSFFLKNMFQNTKNQ